MEPIVTNPRARRDYHILDTFEAGIVLRGTEVKAVREKRVSLREAYAEVRKGEVWLRNARIEEYRPGGWLNHPPDADRKLLLHRHEIHRLQGQLAAKGHTLVPLALYWKNGRIKVELAVARGKSEVDRREDIKRRELDREMRRAMSRQERRPRT
ncbi:MAG: SsrA-binding protein SmpB [Verrucomicrobiota bacterium]|nr:SsrA-binding protein SmpB [Limisphaera sp.]MDW8382060.1 SsrA-binding protein SmpB [Verrucomicrobiota bacterium]